MIKLIVYGAGLYFLLNKMGYTVVKEETKPVQGYCHPLARM
jgi:hypothetical protein